MYVHARGLLHKPGPFSHGKFFQHTDYAVFDRKCLRCVYMICVNVLQKYIDLYL